MPVTEIDTIFAAHGKHKAVLPVPTASVVSRKGKSKRIKNKSSINASLDDATQPSDQPSTKKRPAPETVHDPSSISSVKRAKGDNRGVDRKKAQKEVDERFKDSRGSGPRRRTEEGFAIYKEDELGISTGGGDTPLCPFDCQCCF